MCLFLIPNTACHRCLIIAQCCHNIIYVFLIYEQWLFSAWFWNHAFLQWLGHLIPLPRPPFNPLHGQHPNAFVFLVQRRSWCTLVSRNVIVINCTFLPFVSLSAISHYFRRCFTFSQGVQTHMVWDHVWQLPFPLSLMSYCRKMQRALKYYWRIYTAEKEITKSHSLSGCFPK